MLDRIPWAYCEAAVGLAACATAGALLGALGTLLRIWGERRGS
jgi:hypothetical protein